MSLNRLLLCALCCALVFTARFSFATQSGAPAHDAKAADEQEVLRLNAECNDAELRADLAVMDKCEIDNFTHTHSDGRVENKTEYIKGIGSGDHHFLMLEWSEAHVRSWGDSAIVDGQMHLRANNLGKLADYKLAVMTVWVKQQGKWREAAWIAAKMSPNMAETPVAK
jgi:ketosteroid isomerase-like protein